MSGGGYTMPDVSGIDIGKLSGGTNRGSSGGTRKEPDYIMNNAKGRDIGSKIFLNTGSFWLGGFAAGGLYGFAEGWRGAASPTLRIRINSVLNGVSKRGSSLGNNLGVLVFMYTGINYVAEEVLELDRHTGFDAAVPLASGMVTGAAFNHAKGPRAAMLSGFIGAGISAAYHYGGNFIYSAVLGKNGRY